MKKKLLAMLLVLAMVISIVPLTAIAEDCDHEHADYSHYVSNGKGQHDIICPDCDEGVFGWMFQCKNADTDYNGYCDKCGFNCCMHSSKSLKNNEDGTHTFYCQNCKAQLSTEAHQYSEATGACVCGALKTPVCEHKSKSIKNNNDGTHTFFCRHCGEKLTTEAHQYSEAAGACVCGALAGHECDFDAGVTSNGDGTHNVNCECGKYMTYKCADYNGDHACDSCGDKIGCLYDAGVTSNGDGTHNVNCSCGDYMTLTCMDNDGDGKCDSCGYQKYAPACKHTHKGAVNNNDGTHTIVCRDCLAVQHTEDHTFNAQGICVCGAIQTVCNHTSKSVKNNENGTHTFYCRDCGEKLTTEEHKYDEATDVCICGAIRGHACTFEAGVTSNGDGTHKVSCECGKYVTYKCADYDGDHACDSCGYKMGCLYDAGVTSNGDGTHKVNCSCGDYMTLKCLDPDGDGKCDSCGYQMYTFVCKHNGDLTLKDNGDGNTHKVTCADCNTVLYEQEAHEFNNKGVCACGAKKTAETKPQNPNLDNVPKTGDQSLIAVSAALLLIAMASVTGIVVIRKKHV